MTEPMLLNAAITGLFALMAFRAMRSGSFSDYLLAGFQCLGLLLMLWFYHYGLYLLLITSGAYLTSQILTGARRISYLLPVLGAVLIAFALSLINH